MHKGGLLERFCLIDDCPGKVMARSLCSRHYYNYRNHGTPLPEIICVDCGADLTGAHKGRKRCEPCAESSLRARARERAAAKRPPYGPRNCYRCGEATEPTRNERKLCVKCSQDCNRPCSEPGCDRPVRARNVCSMHYKRLMRAEGAWEPEPWNDRRRNSYHARRALKAGSSAGEPFSNVDVFNRDGWVCGICSEPVSADAVYPDPLSASLDHVVPLSLGGAHSLENVQLAHLSCNVRKGAREDFVVSA